MDSTGIPLDARYEVEAMAEMDALLACIATLPEDALKVQNSTSPFGQRPLPSSPFGNNQQNNQQNQPPKPASPFGSSSPFRKANNINEGLPTLIAACFDALDGTSVFPQASFPPSNRNPFQTDPAPDDTSSASNDLPDDLKGLLGKWFEAVQDNDNRTVAASILHKVGQLNDPCTIDHIYRLIQFHEFNVDLMQTFVDIGGDVGIAGLMTMLPIAISNRQQWLDALCRVTANAMSGDKPLSSAALETVIRVGVAESAPNVQFCPSALNLIAATRRSEWLPLLWEHAQSSDATRRRVALYAISQFDPGERLDELLISLMNLPPNVPQGISAYPTKVGVPFEPLAQIVTSGKGTRAKLKNTALMLIGQMDDPRVVPFLVEQLKRKIPELRLTAATHLMTQRSANTKTVSDAVARLLEKETQTLNESTSLNPVALEMSRTIQKKAADFLWTFHDPRCVPALIQAHSPKLKPTELIRTVRTMDHPEYTGWLLRLVSQLIQNEDMEDTLVEVVNALVEAKSPALPHVLEKLVTSKSQRILLLVVDVLGKWYDIITPSEYSASTDESHRMPSEEWAQGLLHLLLDSRLPPVMYRAALHLRDVNTARKLLKVRSEAKRILGVRILISAKDVKGLGGCLDDRYYSVRLAAAYGLTMLNRTEALTALLHVVSQFDHYDQWGMHPAAFAQQAIGRLKGLQKSAG
jgi:HEAT repeat protein